MPIWSSVANLKQSLSKIALDVHDDDDDELSIYTSPLRDQLKNGNSVSERRISRNFSHSSTPTPSPIPNGFASPPNHEIERYTKEIKRLQESEAEIKALSVNYAALLKEKETQISRLAEENSSLRQNLLTANTGHSASKSISKGNGDVSPNRHNKGPAKLRATGSSLSNGSPPKHDGLSNAKELSNMVEDKNRSFAVLQATHEAQMKQVVVELDKERDKLASMQKKLQEEQKLSGSLQQELSSLKDENSKMFTKIHKIHDELNQKILEVGRLQVESQRRDLEVSDDDLEKLKNKVAALEDENRNIKKEKDEIEVSSREDHAPRVVDLSDELSSSIDKVSPEMEEMQQSLHRLKKDLEETRRERDKTLLELNRLKQHLLEKESEESEKMDEDSKIIEELREINEHQKIQISNLGNALKQAIGSQEEMTMSNNSELMKAKEMIHDLKRKLSSCMSTVDAKNMEVLNLQTALGQYYAEIEAKENLVEELTVSKEALARLSIQLKEAHQQAETSKREKDETLGKLSQVERMLSEGKSRVKKIEENNEKLRRALEQSMTRLNRMSMDSDFLVDRRIVIKLLVTYFQRNHSKEVLDLMVRMLGFSDEDKQRIGVAQQGTGRGVVRGVLGLPGRLVGGILSSSSAEANASMASDDQSFADLWVDFLLTETEREKKEPVDAASGSNPDKPSAGTAARMLDQIGATTIYSNARAASSHGNFLEHKHYVSEFSTVPLTSEGGSRGGSQR